MSVGVCACLTAVAAINWNSGKLENIAQGATVTVSSKDADAKFIADGNDGTAWQANAATHALTQDWVIIDLGESKPFTDMSIVWEASHCKSYSVYVSTEAIPYDVYEEVTETITDGEGKETTKVTPAYKAIKTEWLSAHCPVLAMSAIVAHCFGVESP